MRTGGLLQCRGRERRGRFLDALLRLHAANLKRHSPKRRQNRIRVGTGLQVGLLAFPARQLSRKLALFGSKQPRDRPVFLRNETANGIVASDDQTEGDGLNATGRQSLALYKLP